MSVDLVYLYVVRGVILNTQAHTHARTLEEDDSVVFTLRFWALHGSIQVVWDAREDLRDVLGIVCLQLLIVVPEHHVVLGQRESGFALREMSIFNVNSLCVTSIV